MIEMFEAKKNKCLVSGNILIFFRVGRWAKFFILRIFFTLEKHENHSKYPKNTEKNLKCLKKNLGRPKKVGSVGFPETRHFFFLA